MGNYQAWEIDLSRLGELSAAEWTAMLPSFGVLAPSSHNSQPWKFRVEANRVLVMPDFSRRLTESDSNDRQLYISLGCAAENIIIAADAGGLAPRVRLHESGDGVSIEIIFEHGRQTKPDENHLVYAIPKRLTNRSKYSEQNPADNFLRRLEQIAREHQLELRLISEKELRKKIADLVMKATDEAMASIAFRAELSNYLKPNTTSAAVGMPCFGMDIPTPVSFLAPLLIKRFNLSKITSKQERKLLEEYTPVFAMIFTEGDAPTDWIQAGRAYQRMALEATRERLATNPLAALVQIGDHHKELAPLLGISGRLQIFFRLGHALSAPPHSPRLRAEDVTVDV